MNAIFRTGMVLILALGALGASASPAGAAAPANDLFPDATLAGLGYSEVLDTTEATTDADDAQLNAGCDAPATDASVWYVLEGTDTGVVVDVLGSSYSAGVLVGTGSQGSLELQACGPGVVAFFAAAGTTYYILAFDDQLDGSGNGGSLSISFSEAPPPPQLEISVNRFGTASSRTGIARISGKYTCTDGDFVELGVDARQNVGRFTISGFGYFFEYGTCDGTPHSWAADVVPQNGKFAGGKTLTVAFAYTCGLFECAYGYAEQKVQLRSGK